MIIEGQFVFLNQNIEEIDEMKKYKKMILTIGLSAVVLVSSIGVALASDLFSPAEKLSELTGTSVEALYEAKGDMTFGELAKEEGVLDEFKEDMLEGKKNILDQRVAEKILTQEEADTIYNSLLQNSEDCDGTGTQRREERLGLGFGTGDGMGNGNNGGQGQRCGVKN